MIKKHGNTTHGLPNHPLYTVWNSMKIRCYYTKCRNYNNWGGRGIIICKKWLNFSNFYNWAILNGWVHGLHIDRKDNDKNYEPSNCRFITPRQSSQHKRSVKFYTYKGQSKTLADWSIEKGMNLDSLQSRIYNSKWSIEMALGIPIKIKNKVRTVGPPKGENIGEYYTDSNRVAHPIYKGQSLTRDTYFILRESITGKIHPIYLIKKSNKWRWQSNQRNK